MNKLDSNSQRTFLGQKKPEPPAAPPHSSCLKIKISGKWHIPQIFEIILESYYLAIIERISNPFPPGTNRHVFSWPRHS